MQVFNLPIIRSYYPNRGVFGGLLSVETLVHSHIDEKDKNKIKNSAYLTKATYNFK